jgi:LacI family transcriptional regulator
MLPVNTPVETDVQRDGAVEEMASAAPVVKPAPAVPPTLKGIAQIAGCSTAVVSTVLNKSRGNTQVSEATREKILAIASELNYRPNLTARSMKSRKSLIIGVLVRNNSRVEYAEMGAHPLAYELVLGINEGLEARGYMMSLVRLSDIDPAKHFQASAFQGHLLDGLIVVNQVPAAPRERLEALVPQCVWLDTNVWGPTHCVRRDEQHAGYSAGQQMAALGYRDWLLLSYADDEAQAEEHYSHTQRLSGVRTAAQEHGASLRY